MAFFLILSWPAPKLIRSHPEETCREPPTFPAQPSQSCFQDTKAVSPLPPGFSNCCLMGHTLPGHVMDSQWRPASTTQIKLLVTCPSAGGGRSEKYLYTGSKVATNSAPGSAKSPTGLKHVSVCVCVCVKSFSCVQLFAIPWTVAHQAPLSMEFPRQGYWSG